MSTSKSSRVVPRQPSPASGAEPSPPAWPPQELVRSSSRRSSERAETFPPCRLGSGTRKLFRSATDPALAAKAQPESEAPEAGPDESEAPEPEQRGPEAEAEEKQRQLLEPAAAKKETKRSRSWKDRGPEEISTMLSDKPHGSWRDLPQSGEKWTAADGSKPLPPVHKVHTDMPERGPKLSPVQATRKIMRTMGGSSENCGGSTRRTMGGGSSENCGGSTRRGVSTSQASTYRPTYTWMNAPSSERSVDAHGDHSFRKKLAEIGFDFERLHRDFSCAQSENKNLWQEIRRLRLSIAEREQALKEKEDNVSDCGDMVPTATMPTGKFDPKDIDKQMGKTKSWGGMFFARNATDGHSMPQGAMEKRISVSRLFGPRGSVDKSNDKGGFLNPPVARGSSRRSSKETVLNVVPTFDEGTPSVAGLPSAVEMPSEEGVGATTPATTRLATKRSSKNSIASSSPQVLVDYAHSSEGEAEEEADGSKSGGATASRNLASNNSRRSSTATSGGPDGMVQQRSVRNLFKGLSGLLPGTNASSAKGEAAADGNGTGSQETLVSAPYQVRAASSSSQEYVDKAWRQRMLDRSVSFFPDYFSPTKDEEPAANFTDSCHYSAVSATTLEIDADNDGSRCALAPAGRCRLVWDFLTLLCLLFELWIIPFHLAFVLEFPESVTLMLHSVTGTFFLDILLNFFTGYIKENVLVMRQPWMARRYLKTWFFWDLLATVPFGLLQANFHVVRLIRILKLPRLLRAFRHFRIVQYLEVLLVRDQSASLEASGIRGGFFLKYCGMIAWAILSVALAAHFHACVRWALLQSDGALLAAEGHILHGTADSRDSFIVALRQYYGSFWWAYTALTVGRSADSTSPLMWTFELFVATERLVFLAFAGIWAVQQAMVYHESDARVQVVKDDAMKYMKHHKVSFKTRLEVLSTLQQTRASTEMQRHFDELVEGFPEEVRRKINEELWSKKLMSLELIRMIWDWHPPFLRELSMLVREETIASKSVVCHEGDASIAAYMVLRGELRIVIKLASNDIPNFSAGMWVGEKALVNPGLRRSATVVAVTLTSLMAVPAEGFQELLSRFSLRRRFEELCEEQLWKGLCGRCGSLGNHFSDACPHMNMSGFMSPHMKRKLMRLTEKKMNSASTLEAGDEDAPIAIQRCGSSLRSNKSTKTPTLERTLTEFLKMNDVFRLAPLCQRLNITNLETLEMTDLDELRMHEVLTEEEVAALSPESFEDFRDRIKSAGRIVLRKGALHRTQHLMFLSHYKVEAGTEAALMRSELEQLMSEDPCSLGRHFDVPVFLDSEDLTNLKTLQERVIASHNIVVLLTKDVFTRPWVLVEIVSAIRWCIPVLLVTVEKAGSKFEFPTDSFFDSLSAGDSLSKQDQAVLAECGIPTEEVVNVLKSVLKRIAVPYSPHKSGVIRRAELQALLEEVSLREEPVGGMQTVQSTNTMAITASSFAQMGSEAGGALGSA